MVTIKSLHIYPIKSLGGIELVQSKVERRGLQYDRRWMLIDENGRFVSQRENPKLALLQPSIKDNLIFVEDRSGTLSTLGFEMSEPSSSPMKVTIWDDECEAKPLDMKVNQWFSEFLGKTVQLVYMHDDSQRIADQRYAPAKDDVVSFADGYPILAISQESLDLLNSKLETEIPMDRFRPNLVLQGLEAHEEDALAQIEIGALKLFGVKPCARCVMTTINQQTAEKGAEPLKTLASYRKTGNKILFGENFIPETDGWLKVGDDINIRKRKKALV